MVPVREARANHITAQGKGSETKNPNQQFDLADASFWKLRGLVCVLFCFSTYQQKTRALQNI